MSIIGRGIGIPPVDIIKIQDQLLEYAAKLQELQMKATPSSSNQSRQYHLQRIMQIEHQRSRMIYQMYYIDHAISPELYKWLLRNGYANTSLIAKWKKPGYSRLCCLHCISQSDIKPACICRVPSELLDTDQQNITCIHCGCRGCSN